MPTASTSFSPLTRSLVAIATAVFLASGVFIFAQYAFATPSTVVINEFVSDVTGGNSEWVELYNPTGADVSLAGWTLKDSNGHTHDLSGNIAAGSFATFDVTQLNNPGDVITLDDASSSVVDSVAYGTAGAVDAPGKGESAGRAPDGSSNWVIFTTPSNGASNNGGTITLTPSAPTSVTVGDTVSFTAQSSDLKDPIYSVSSSNDSFITAGNIDATTGAFSWTPSITEMIGGDTKTITITATSGTYKESKSIDISVTLTPSFYSLNVDDAAANSGSPAVLSSTLLLNFPVAGIPYSGQDVGFSVDGTFVGTSTTDANGVATTTYTPSLSVGDYVISAVHYGLDTVTGSGTLTITAPAPLPVEDTTNSTYFSTIADAIASSTTNAGDTIALLSDLTVPSQINVNKDVTIDGQGHTVSVSGTGYRFLITGDGTTLKDMNITKTDKTGVQNIVGIQADNVTIDGVDFTGQYAAGDNDVSRALEISGNDFTIENSSFKNLRQPAYINSYTGSVTNNYTDGTKGWVVVQDSNVTFSGNTWGTNATDIAIIQQGTGANHYTCAITAQIRADNNNATVDNQVDSSCTPVLNAENFNTVDDSTYKGISVGFDARNFGTVSAVTVDMTRADGSHAIKHGTQDLFNLISANTAPYQFTAPFVITAGTYDPTTDSYWTSDPTTWTNATTPTSVTITVTGSNGTKSVTNSNFSQGAPSWPTYESLLPPTPPAAPENLNLTQSGNTYACDGTAFFNASSSVYGTHLNWSLPAGETESEYKVVPTYPSGSHGTAYTWTSGTSVWIGANIGQGYGAAPHDQGTYSYSLTYKNLLGDWSDPATCSFIYDTVAPTVSVTPAAADGALSGTVTFDITINDANAATSSNSAIWVYIYNTKDGSQKYGQKVDLSSGTGTFTVDTTKLIDGSYDLDVGIVHDAFGNPSGTKDNYFDGYTIANGTPTPTNTHFIYRVGTLACGSTVNTTFNNSIQFVWDDPITEPHHRTLITYPDGTTKMAYTNSRNVWMSKTNYGDNGFGNAAGEKGNGIYTYQVQAENAAGQWSDMAPACTIALDTQSPKANFDPVPPEYVNGNFSVSGDASDNVALKSVLFDVRDSNAKGNQWVAGCVAGTQTTTWGAASTTAQTSCTINTKNLTEGYPYILRIHAGDYAGYGSAGQQQTLILDTTRPNAAITAPADKSTQTGTFTITGTATDTLSGIDHVNIYVSKVVAPNAKGSTFGGYVVDDQAATWDAVTDTFSYDVSGLADGTYVIKADAFDKAGNEHFASPSPTITVQNVAPVYVTTNAPTDITFSDAQLNGANGDSDATGHSFWVSNSTIDTSSPNIPADVYSTPDFGAISANTGFSASLSSLTTDAVVSGGAKGTMPAITPDTTYHYVAWSDVGGTWHPGIEQMFTTSLETPTIISPFDGESTTTAGWQNITWTAVPSVNGPVTYTYQVSGSDATSTDGSFTSPLVTTPGITATSISQGNTGDGTYYMHVMATDSAGNTSAWSPTVKVIVDNSGSGSGGGTTPLTYTFATTTVTIGNLNGWTESDTAGGAVGFVSNSNAPIGNGALELTTTADDNSVTHFTHSFDIPLNDLSAISFSTKQLSAADTTNGNITLRVNVNLDGTSDSVDDQLMYEPYYNGFNGTSMMGWNAWNISTTTGKFWSNESLKYNGLGGVSAGSYASNFTLADVLHDHPSAKIVGLVLSMGTWNPSQTVLADGLLVSELDGTNASTTIFDFEPRTGTITTITNASDLQNNASTAGDPVTVEWNVASVSGKGTPTGTVTVYVNGSAASGCTADISDGQCSFTPSSAGSVEIYAQYNGDGTFDQSDTKSVMLSHTVNVAGGNNNGGNSGGSGGSNGSPIGNSLIGDINHDGSVNFIDFALLMSAMGEKGTGLPADLDNNGSVGTDDLAIFFANWKI